MNQFVELLYNLIYNNKTLLKVGVDFIEPGIIICRNVMYVVFRIEDLLIFLLNVVSPCFVVGLRSVWVS